MGPKIIPMKQEMTMLHLPGVGGRTGRLTGVFAVPLKASTAAGYAILPGLLTRCCRRYPTVPAFSRQLDSLYGTSLEGQVTSLGSWQLLVFTASFLRDEYTLDGGDLAAEVTRLLLDTIFDPAFEDGVFRQADFEQEQRCLTEMLQSELNEKRMYARRRCKELLCPDHPFSLNPHGTEETVAALTPEAATDALVQMVSTARIHWIYQGDGDIDTLIHTIEAPFLDIIPRLVPAVSEDTAFTMKQSEKTDEMPLNQAKLVMGFRIAATEPDGDVMAARLMNTLWGGSASSLLFKHVREEQSLCYYCASSYDRYQGVLLVDSGVEAKNAERTVQEVLKQLDAIRHGNFSQEELDAARRTLIQRFAGLEDTAADRESWYIGQTLYDRYITPDEAGKLLAAVTKEDVCRAAHLVHFDTTYLLKPVEEVTAE